MPKSKTRKRNNRPVRATHRPRRPALAMVAQRTGERLLNDLEALVRAVPTDDLDDSIEAVVAHHMASSAVVGFIRQHDVIELLATLLGGAMVVPDEMPGEFACPNPWHDSAPARARGLQTCPECLTPVDEGYDPPADLDDDPRLWTGESVSDRRSLASAVAGAGLPVGPVRSTNYDGPVRRVPGANLHAALLDEAMIDEAQGLEADVALLERIRDGLAGPGRGRWDALVGKDITVPQGATNANTHKGFERAFAMQVHTVTPWGDDHYLVEGALLRADRTLARVSKRAIVTWDDVTR